MNTTLQDLMREATRLTQSGQLKDATVAIQRALSGASNPSPTADFYPEQLNGVGMLTRTVWPDRQAKDAVLDGYVFEPGTQTPPPADDGAAAASDSDYGAGEFISASHTYAGLTRRYKLYIPPGHTGRSLPLVVMLHGCTQDPDDFAAGTGMNGFARSQGFFVLYPAQAQDANPSRCWNWFKHSHQRRDKGEPGVLADMVRSVVRQYALDARRVYVAGLSAGGAMAAILGELYPELFAAVGVHSGLASGAAGNVSEALATMRNGPDAGATPASHKVPTIVFHGDQDRTVHPRNGEQVVASVLAGTTGTTTSVERQAAAQGRRYTHTVHHGASGRAVAEHWLVHGAGHAWSGGTPEGSYTDTQGPDASAEMLRFFLQHPRG